MYKRRISHLQQARPADIKLCPTYIKYMPTIYKGVHLYIYGLRGHRATCA